MVFEIPFIIDGIDSTRFNRMFFSTTTLRRGGGDMDLRPSHLNDGSPDVLHFVQPKLPQYRQETDLWE